MHVGPCSEATTCTLLPLTHLLPPSQVKQSWRLNEKTFMPTSNARNCAMLKEAATFADHLKHCEKDIRNLKNASEGEK
jgi:hypothetical protein